MNYVVRVCHSLARAYLSGRANANKLARRHGINLDDVAIDCIAEIFQRNEAGEYVQLRAYFFAVPPATCSAEDTLFHLQRLVFSKAQHVLYRLYQEADPPLGKILRNIKAAIQSLGQFTESERFGSTCIAPALCDTLEHLPPLDSEVLERALLGMVRGDEHIPELLGRLSQFLRGQSDNSRILSLMTVASVIRRIYERKQLIHAGEPTTEIDITSLDSRAIILSSCREVKARQGGKYVGNAKLTQDLLAFYFDVIEEGLTRRFVQHDGVDFSFFAELKCHLPGMIQNEYKTEHKAILEYLYRLTLSLVVKRLKSNGIESRNDYFLPIPASVRINERGREKNE